MQVKFINSAELLAQFSSDIPRIFLPPDIAKQHEQRCEDFLSGLDTASLKRRRNEVRPAVNAVIEKVLRGQFEPPLSAFLRELPGEVLCFYIERLRLLERTLRLTAIANPETIRRPASMNEYWLQQLIKA